MRVKRYFAECALKLFKILMRTTAIKESPSIFVLRNNDLGDLVVVTSLFRALRKSFPQSKIVAGVGDWGAELLANNPNITQVVGCNAPWHNKFTGKHSLFNALRYIISSSEAKTLADARFDIGIDVVGSVYGSLLLMRMGVPVRLGRVGYAGGESGATAVIPASMNESVAENALRFARLFSHEDVSADIELFLTNCELASANALWAGFCGERQKLRVVISPGAGLHEKRWPADRFSELISGLDSIWHGIILGSLNDTSLASHVIGYSENWENLCGKTSLRESAALIAACDVVVCNSSFVMHLAGAFSKPCIVILNRTQDPAKHSMLWEIPGVHHQCFPHKEEKFVSVEVVAGVLEDLRTRLLS